MTEALNMGDYPTTPQPASTYKGYQPAHNVGHQNAIMAGMMTAKDWADAVITLMPTCKTTIRNVFHRMIDAFEEGNEIVYGVKVSRKADPIFEAYVCTGVLSFTREDGREQYL